MMKSRKNELRKAMMEDRWDIKDAPASCEVQMKVRCGIWGGCLMNLNMDESEYASLPIYQYTNNESEINRVCCIITQKE